MNEALRQTQSHLRRLLSQYGINPRNNLGQNYLIDLNILDFLVDNANLTNNDVVLEVGTGTGGMTAFMTAQAGHVISVELDKNMHRMASEQIGHIENLTLLQADALKNKNNFSPKVLELVEEQLAINPKRRLKLIANLPYSIATPVVSNLVATDLPWERIVVTIQLELGLRMQAKPRRSTYGALSIWLQSQTHVKLLKKFPPSVFWPRPKVHSAIMQLVPNPQAKKLILNRPFLQDFLRRLFHQRRKLMRSVLVGMYRKEMPKAEIDQILQEMEFEPNTRAEELPPETLVKLANLLYEKTV
jgi:16S rRNA (adenine1518-N6/adenine1519-N6)-dimethyltransferase